MGQLAGVVPGAVIVKWQKLLRDDGWYGYHHYCAGIAWLFSSASTLDPLQRERDLRAAVSEITYAVRSTRPANPLFTTISVNLARAYDGLGERDKARDYFQKAREAHPQLEGGHAAMAAWLWDLGEVSKARDVLEEGIGHQRAASAELHYMLGLVQLELGEAGEARRHADLAYGLGYPLPGLRQKLASVDQNSER